MHVCSIYTCVAICLVESMQPDPSPIILMELCMHKLNMDSGYIFDLARLIAVCNNPNLATLL